jgi:hypothetical protein
MGLSNTQDHPMQISSFRHCWVNGMIGGSPALFKNDGIAPDAA